MLVISELRALLIAKLHTQIKSWNIYYLIDIIFSYKKRLYNFYFFKQTFQSI